MIPGCLLQKFPPIQPLPQLHSQPLHISIWWFWHVSHCYALYLIHNCIPIHALCGLYVQNTWMNKWINFEIPESLNIVVICEHIRICSFIYRLMVKSLNMNFSDDRQVQVKSYIWHLKIVRPWESYLTTLSFSFLLFKITKLILAIS